MAYIINQSCGDFQQGGCLYKPTNGIQWTPEHSWTSDRTQKQASAKADPSMFGHQIKSLVSFFPIIEIEKSICKPCLSNTVFSNITIDCGCHKSLMLYLHAPISVSTIICTPLYNWRQAEKNGICDQACKNRHICTQIWHVFEL